MKVATNENFTNYRNYERVFYVLILYESLPANIESLFARWNENKIGT